MSNGETPGGFQPSILNPPPDSGPTRALHFARDLHARGRLVEAERFYRETLAVEPDRAEALHLLGVLEAQRGDYTSALSLIIRAAGLDPSNSTIPYNLGNALRDSGRPEQALVAYGRALKLDPAHSGALKNRGAILFELGSFEEALADCERALLVTPEDAVLHANRGNALLGLKRYDDALASYSCALRLKPGHADALFGRGNALSGLQRYDEALADYERALIGSPDHAEGIANYGGLLFRSHRYDDALAAFAKAVAKKPDGADAHRGLGATLFELRRSEEAAAAYDRAFALRPDLEWLEGTRLLSKLYICDWSNIGAERARLAAHVAAGKRASDPFAFLGADCGPREQLLCAQSYAAARYPAREPLARGARYGHRKIRVGYVSGELREQATAYLTAGLFEYHDRNAVELHAFSTGIDDASPMRRRIEAAFDTFTDVSPLSDRAVAEKIKAAEIDVLVNLNGYFGAERTGIFAFKPSPIQVNYLGFPGTMGAPYMDYILADALVIPKEHRVHYSEKVVYLPDCYQANDSKRPLAPATPPRAQLGLPQHGFVFSCFNNAYKITPEIFGIWMRLLAQAPNSVLWLLEVDPATRRNLVNEAAKRGLGPDRLVFAPFVTAAEHLARIAAADLFLDTLPINAHTTASDALWSGVPVLTCPGRTFASRVAASLNRAVKLDEMVVNSAAEYEALALKFAKKPLLLAAIRKKLALHRKSHPLFDTARLTRHIEAAYRIMWERAERGEAPAPFSVGPDGSKA